MQPYPVAYWLVGSKPTNEGPIWSSNWKLPRRGSMEGRPGGVLHGTKMDWKKPSGKKLGSMMKRSEIRKVPGVFKRNTFESSNYRIIHHDVFHLHWHLPFRNPLVSAAINLHMTSHGEPVGRLGQACKGCAILTWITCLAQFKLPQLWNLAKQMGASDRNQWDGLGSSGSE